MIIKAPLCLTILLCCGFLNHAQNKVRLDNRATIVFPGKTEQMQGATGPVTYSTLDKENKVTGMATVVDAAAFGVDSGMIAANYNNTVFIDLILQNLVGMRAGVVVVSRKKIARDGEMGYEVVLKNDQPDETVPYKHLYGQVFFAGSNVYAVTVLTEEDIDVTKEKESFFSSLKID